MPGAARLNNIGSGHDCFPENPITEGSADVIINGQPTARQGYNEINCFTPNLFISKRKKWLLHYLNLTQKNTVEEKLIKKHLVSMRKSEYTVLVPSNYSVDNKRVYIIKSFS
ncbi:Imm15 family immunity protein [Pectobacterium sp. B1J-3]|uniref:Imm15 family immunity protein n=1 Tax=Pectobacterium sp. B1J-3 TaxID=3385371 RepID=UPI0039058CF5